MKKKIYNIILIILALILLVVISIIAFKRINNQIKEKELINTVADIKVKLEEIKESENDEKTTQYTADSGNGAEPVCLRRTQIRRKSAGRLHLLRRGNAGRGNES